MKEIAQALKEKSLNDRLNAYKDLRLFEYEYLRPEARPSNLYFKRYSN